MDDAQAAKLRALAERAREAMAKYRTDPSYPTGAAMVDDWINVAPLYNDAPDTILALLDTVDALRVLRELVTLEADGRHADEWSVEAWERARAVVDGAHTAAPSFDEWYDSAHWGNEDFREGCRRAWEAALAAREGR